jgi:hypothetical protein
MSSGWFRTCGERRPRRRRHTPEENTPKTPARELFGTRRWNPDRCSGNVPSTAPTRRGESGGGKGLVPDASPEVILSKNYGVVSYGVVSLKVPLRIFQVPPSRATPSRAIIHVKLPSRLLGAPPVGKSV